MVSNFFSHRRHSLSTPPICHKPPPKEPVYPSHFYPTVNITVHFTLFCTPHGSHKGVVILRPSGIPLNWTGTYQAAPLVISWDVTGDLAAKQIAGTGTGFCRLMSPSSFNVRWYWPTYSPFAGPLDCTAATGDWTNITGAAHDP